METIALSPPGYGSRKRPLDERFIGSPADCMSLPQALHSSSNDHLKRGRMGNDENQSPLPSFEKSSHEVKRIRLQNGTDPNILASGPSSFSSQILANQKQLESISQYHEMQLQYVRNDYERKLQQKDEQILNLSKISKQVHDTNIKLEQENKSLIEENKIFKKAIHIQDNRQREMTQQNQQYQMLLQQLTEYISNLEKANGQLRDALRYNDTSSSNGTYYYPPPPPDVY